jgi:predicted ATPase
MNYLRNAIKIASVIVGLTAPMTAAFADQGNLSLAGLPALTGEWWQWVLSIPSSVSPLGKH